jgi:hypothetical protein
MATASQKITLQPHHSQKFQKNEAWGTKVWGDGDSLIILIIWQRKTPFTRSLQLLIRNLNQANNIPDEVLWCDAGSPNCRSYESAPCYVDTPGERIQSNSFITIPAIKPQRLRLKFLTLSFTLRLYCRGSNPPGLQKWWNSEIQRWLTLHDGTSITSSLLHDGDL